VSEVGHVTRAEKAEARAERAEAEVARFKSKRRRLRGLRRAVGRWAWIAPASLTVYCVLQGDAFGAAIWGMLLGQEFEGRFRSDPGRNELRMGLSREEAERLADELLAAGGREV
jgi:hypothetical protein